MKTKKYTKNNTKVTESRLIIWETALERSVYLRLHPYHEDGSRYLFSKNSEKKHEIKKYTKQHKKKSEIYTVSSHNKYIAIK